MIHHLYRATLTIAAAATVLAALPAQATDRGYSPCEYEDSTNCVWDAKHMGNGSGRSFLSTKKGKTIFIPHRAAHQLLNG